MPKPLTPRQMRLYNYITNPKYWRQPTFRMMKLYMKIKSNNAIQQMIRLMKKKGWEF